MSFISIRAFINMGNKQKYNNTSRNNAIRFIREFIKGNTYIFIDASNIHYAQKDLKWKIDYKKLKKLFSKRNYSVKFFYYTAYDTENSEQKKFLDLLEIIKFTVRKKKVKFIKSKTVETGGFHKGNLDVELTIDAINFKDMFDTFVLFSGDSDFESLVKYMKREGKKCLVFSTKKHISIELIKQAKFIDIKKLRKEIEWKGKKNPSE